MRRVSATLKYLEQNMYDDGMETLAPVRAFSDIPIVYTSRYPSLQTPEKCRLIEPKEFVFTSITPMTVVLKMPRLRESSSFSYVIFFNALSSF